MDRVIVFTRSDGSTAVLVPVGLKVPVSLGFEMVEVEPGKDMLVEQFREESEDEYLARIAAQDVPVLLDNGTEVDRRAADAAKKAYTQLPFAIVARSDVPVDRTYRGAWTLDGSNVKHDMLRARELHRERLRQQRPVVFAKLDELYMRADEAGNATAKAAIALRKKALRDAPADPRIEAAATTDELKAIVLPE